MNISHLDTCWKKLLRVIFYNINMKMKKVLEIFRKIGRKFYETFQKINYIQAHYTTPSFPFPSFIFPPFLFLPSPYCYFPFRGRGVLPRSSLGVWESIVTYRAGRSQKFMYFILFIYLGVSPLLLLLPFYVSSLSPFPLQYFFPFAAKRPRMTSLFWNVLVWSY